MEGRQQGQMPKGLVQKMAVNGSVDGKNKHGEVDKEPSIIHSSKATPTLLEMHSKTVYRDGKTWDVKGIPNEDLFPI